MSSKSPTVSVIIPNYNHALFLPERIDSVLAQSYQDFEIIILDDHSTDNSRDVIDSYRNDPRITTVLYNEVNGGNPFHQWVKGIVASRGKYIWIAESDDWCENNLLERLIVALEADKKCHVSYCQSYCVEEDGKIQWQSFHHKLDEVMEGKTFIREYMLLRNSIFNASMAVWRKEVFSEILPDFMEYKFAGDKLFWIRLAQQGRVAINGRLMNYFRKHKGDVTGTAVKSGLGCLEEMRILNVMYTEKLIDSKEYYLAYKKNYREYRSLMKNVEFPLRKEIQSLLHFPLSGKASYIKVFFSTVWREIKSK